MRYNPEIHDRRTIRLKGYDYTQAGAYFVTLCTCQREEIFGEISNGKMDLSALGRLVREEWFRSAEIRKEMQLFDDEFVIMPDHLHGIVRIVGADGVRPNIETTVKTGRIPSAPTGAPPIKTAQMPSAPIRAPLRRVPRSLGSFIAGFKAAVTSRAKHELNSTGIWQSNYYEHIIRNETEFKRIWNYIDTNPLRWQKDRSHRSAPPNDYIRE